MGETYGGFKHDTRTVHEPAVRHHPLRGRIAGGARHRLRVDGGQPAVVQSDLLDGVDQLHEGEPVLVEGLPEWARRLAPRTLHQMLQETYAARGSVTTNLNPQLMLEKLLIDWSKTVGNRSAWQD